MPKMKTNKSAAKRSKVTGKGRVKRRHAFKSHILTKKTAKRVRNLGKKAVVSKADRKAVKSMLPYEF